MAKRKKRLLRKRALSKRITKRRRRKNPTENGVTLRRFYLNRDQDVTGVSGGGVVAIGVRFPNGQSVMQWQTKIKSLVVYQNPDDLIAVHGHDGKTQLKWID